MNASIPAPGVHAEGIIRWPPAMGEASHDPGPVVKSVELWGRLRD